VGSLITSLSPNIGTLLVGWSVVEGRGAVLVIPALAALTAANYKGKARAVAFGILQSSQWGWVLPNGALTIAGTQMTPFGLSVVPFLIMAGGVLLQTSRLGIKRLRAGLSMLSAQQLVIAGVFFVIPVYLQTVLLKNALQTGLLITPMSVGVILFAMASPRLASRFAPRSIVRAGLGLMLAASFLLMLTISPTLRSIGFAVALALLGAGIGLIVSQLGNVNLSSVDESRTSEVGGLQGVFQNLGGSLGTALIGATLLMGLTSGFQERVLADPAIPADVQQKLVDHTQAGVQIVSEPEALKYLEDALVLREPVVVKSILFLAPVNAVLLRWGFTTRIVIDVFLNMLYCVLIFIAAVRLRQTEARMERRSTAR